MVPLCGSSLRWWPRQTPFTPVAGAGVSWAAGWPATPSRPCFSPTPKNDTLPSYAPNLPLSPLPTYVGFLVQSLLCTPSCVSVYFRPSPDCRSWLSRARRVRLISRVYTLFRRGQEEKGESLVHLLTVFMRSQSCILRVEGAISRHGDKKHIYTQREGQRDRNGSVLSSVPAGYCNGTSPGRGGFQMRSQTRLKHPQSHIASRHGWGLLLDRHEKNEVGVRGGRRRSKDWDGFGLRFEETHQRRRELQGETLGSHAA